MKDIKIKQGGKTEFFGKKIETISFCCDSQGLQMWINGSLTYLSVQEIMEMKKQIQKALEEYIQ